MYHYSIPSRPASIIPFGELITDSVYAHYLHTLAPVQTALHGEQTGEIMAVVSDPFGTSGMMCYVVSLPWGPQWTEYVPIRSVPAWHLADCTDCGRQVDSRTQMCPECGYCLACCDCPPSHLDDDDFPYYADTGEDSAYDDYHDRQAIVRLGYGG